MYVGMYLYACMNECMYIYVCVCAFVCVCMRLCVCASMYIHLIFSLTLALLAPVVERIHREKRATCFL